MPIKASVHGKLGELFKWHASVHSYFWGSMLHGHFRQTTMALPTRVKPGEPHKL
jgi:hypothetical protein